MMDIPQVLERMGLSGEDWGPMAQTGVSYDRWRPYWRGKAPPPREQDMLAAWAQIVAARRRKREAEAVAAELYGHVGVPDGQPAWARRLARAACAALAAELLRSPALGQALGVPVAGDEPDPG